MLPKMPQNRTYLVDLPNQPKYLGCLKKKLSLGVLSPWGLVKVSKSRKQFRVYSILPKNEQNALRILLRLSDVDKILPIINHLPIPCLHLCWNSFTEINKNLHTVWIFSVPPTYLLSKYFMNAAYSILII